MNAKRIFLSAVVMSLLASSQVRAGIIPDKMYANLKVWGGRYVSGFSIVSALSKTHFFYKSKRYVESAFLTDLTLLSASFFIGLLTTESGLKDRKKLECEKKKEQQGQQKLSNQKN